MNLIMSLIIIKIKTNMNYNNMHKLKIKTNMNYNNMHKLGESNQIVF